MVTGSRFRDMALSFAGAVEGGHFDVTDFRVKGRIFATWRDKDSRAVLKLAPDQQKLLMETSRTVFSPVDGSWGQKGWTKVALDIADEATLHHAMKMAWSTLAR
ncbi:hypothetical protein ASD50_04100 [Mesorhizobium sp. Root552]|uniref:MmcQ/YjbR family DNA-binding protein n=1 Tax=Mesorhizobium sp. Root552 TaxID=1736555 RepID=UPI0006FED84E|nr:MmcQ/YjbR family DNA-binding protein [Mesorhizobium sp. Root552]KQZ26754.1 hypothetical protein ASD50_04100 [Mesorhizobium sp. Root552]